MPTYEFKCGGGHVTEQFLPISKIPDSVPCGTCGQAAVRGIGGGSATILKGFGWTPRFFPKKAKQA